MSSFVYEPVDSNEHEIRLLKILPLQRNSTEASLTDPARLMSSPFASAPEEIVTCTLEVVSLHKCPNYLALSYTWGDPKILKSIQIKSVNDKSKRTFEVTVNLDTALRHIRQERNPVCIWADAICINQSDEIEKTGQVQLMREIYEKSTSALVWLGLAAEESDAAMEGLDRVGRKAFEAGILDLRKDDYLNWPRPDPEGRRSAKQKAVDDLIDEDDVEFPYHALKTLSERNYWTRVWIVQEVAVPKEVTFMCGFKRLQYRNFAAAILFLARKRGNILRTVTAADLSDSLRGAALTTAISTYPSPALGVLIGARRKYQDIGEREPLIDLLTRGCVVASAVRSDRQASDLRDRIYGLLGLSSDCDDLKIIPDYSKGVVETYASVARALITHGYTDILAWCQKPDDPHQQLKEDLQGLPSWVPDFSSPIRDPCGEPQKFGLFSASGQRGVSCLPVVPNVYSPILGITGSTVDTIESLGSHWAPGLDSNFKYLAAKDFITHIEELCDKSQGCPSSILQDPDRLTEAKWRIPCAGQVFTSTARRRRVSTTTMEGYHELKQRLARYPEMGDQLQSPACQGYVIAMEYLHNRRPFISTEGYVGLVPAHSLPGDSICILYGAIVPFVLRRAINGEFELVGEAYVYGIMDGEFLEGSPKEEIFHLR
jgi:hypothetical protein